VKLAEPLPGGGDEPVLALSGDDSLSGPKLVVPFPGMWANIFAASRKDALSEKYLHFVIEACVGGGLQLAEEVAPPKMQDAELWGGSNLAVGGGVRKWKCEKVS
jgi:hypothetical protein